MRSSVSGRAARTIGDGRPEGSRSKMHAKHKCKDLLLGAGKNNRNSEPMSETRAKEESWKVVEVR